jgi:hypothetical protein
MKLSTIQKNYNRAVMAYVNAFEKKQDCECDFAVSEEFDGILCFGGDTFIHFSDLKYDIDHDCKKGLIFDWSDDCVVYHNTGKRINYPAYSKGIRWADLKDSPV